MCRWVAITVVAFACLRAGVRAAEERGDLANFPKEVAEDLAACATAADVVDVCSLVLADPALADSVRQSLELHRTNFEMRAGKGEVRFGEQWVEPEVARQAADKAADHLVRAVEMMRLGNVKLVEDELRQASRVDPAGWQADFVIGLAFMLRNRPDYGEAVASFEEVLRRQPACGPAWNNIAVCKAQQRHYSQAVEAFRSAASALHDRGAVIANLATLIQFAADRRSRISSRDLDGIRETYHELLKTGGAAPPGAPGLVILSPAGLPVVPGAADLSSMLAPHDENPASADQDFGGLVVAPDAVLCPVSTSTDRDLGGLVVAMSDGRNLPARKVSATPDGAFVLLKCEGLGVTPVALASDAPKPGAAVTVVDPVFGPISPAPAVTGTGLKATVLARHAAAPDRPRLLIDLGEAAQAASVGVGPGTLLLDSAGGLVGLGMRQPPALRTAGAKRVVIPVEVVWRLLRQLDESIVPKAPTADAAGQSVAESVARCQAAVVRVLAGQPATASP